MKKGDSIPPFSAPSPLGAKPLFYCPAKAQEAEEGKDYSGPNVRPQPFMPLPALHGERLKIL
jgi:hypothetical protein